MNLLGHPCVSCRNDLRSWGRVCFICDGSGDKIKSATWKKEGCLNCACATLPYLHGHSSNCESLRPLQFNNWAAGQPDGAIRNDGFGNEACTALIKKARTLLNRRAFTLRVFSLAAMIDAREMWRLSDHHSHFAGSGYGFESHFSRPTEQNLHWDSFLPVSSYRVVRIVTERLSLTVSVMFRQLVGC